MIDVSDLKLRGSLTNTLLIFSCDYLTTNFLEREVSWGHEDRWKNGSQCHPSNKCVLMEIRSMHAEVCYRVDINDRCGRGAGYLEEVNVLIWGEVAC